MNAKIMIVRISWNLSLGTKFHFNVNSWRKKKNIVLTIKMTCGYKPRIRKRNAHFVNYFLSVAFRVVMPFRNRCHMLFHNNLWNSIFFAFVRRVKTSKEREKCLRSAPFVLQNAKDQKGVKRPCSRVLFQLCNLYL